jgi:putative hydrolase of the HAD superfamily
MIKAIIFDYGKVIGNDPSDYIYKAVSKEFKISKDKIRDEFFKFIFPLEKGKIPEKIFWKKFAENLKIANYRKLRKIWIEEFQKHAEIDKKVLSLIHKLKNYYRLCLLSNNAIFYQKPSLTTLLKKNFSTIIYSFKIKMRKPENIIYLYTLKKLNLKPEECLIIDDDESKLSYPKKLGMKTIHFKSFLQFKDDLIAKLNNERLVI